MNKEKLKLCECGCGGEVTKPGNRFISGHNRRGVKLDDDLKKRIGESESRFYEENSVSDETREKLRIAGLGRKVSEETREKLRIAKLGKKASDEARENMRIAQLGHKVSDEARENMGIAKLGNKNALGHEVSEEAREKIRTAHLGRKHTDEACENMRIAQLGHEVSEKTREKISVGNLGKKISDEAREKTRIGNLGNTNGLGYKHTYEARILMSCIKLGISRDEWDGFGSVYCELWCEELREYIRDKYNRICFICGKTEEENGVKLSVHHIDYNKDCGCDGTECRLVPLCISCHGKTTSGDREMWEDLIMNMLEEIE